MANRSDHQIWPDKDKVRMPLKQWSDKALDLPQRGQRRGLVSVTTMRKVPGKLLLTV